MVLEWSAGFEAFVGRFAGRFPRVESRRQMVAYLRGLLGEAERKNGWTLAETAGAGGPQGMQRLLNSTPGTSTGGTVALSQRTSSPRFKPAKQAPQSL